MNLVAINGRAVFDQHDVAFDVEAAPDKRGPYLAWLLFVWIVNDMVPETFITKGRKLKLEKDSPGKGWITEQYETARVMRPPVNSTDKVIVQADDMRLYPVWDQAMQQVVSGSIHRH